MTALMILLKVYDENNNYQMYEWKNSRLLNCQNNKKNQQETLLPSLHPFSSEKAYKNHLEKECLASEGQQTKMPDKDTYIEFEKHNTKLPCPCVIYGDFECLTTNSNNGKKGTYQEHKPCGYTLNVVSRIDHVIQSYMPTILIQKWGLYEAFCWKTDWNQERYIWKKWM